MPDIANTMRERIRTHARAAAGRWYDIRNAMDGTPAVIRVYGEISDLWGISADDFARDLAGLDASEIEVQINSPGGDVFDGVAIFNALRAHPARVVTRVDGVAASIASVIAQAGDHRVILSGAQTMIHEARGFAFGTAVEMREFADLLTRQNDNIAAIYAGRAGKDAAEFSDLMAGGDTWFTADETVEMGLADEVVDPAVKEKPAAATDLLERLTSLEQTLAATAALQAGKETSPAGEREETPADTDEVDGEVAERLLASLSWKETA